MNGMTLLVGLAAVWSCIALLRGLVGVARREREPKVIGPIPEPGSLITVLRDDAELGAALERAIRFELSADESLRRRVERYATLARSPSKTGAVLELPTPSRGLAEGARRSA